MELIQDIYDAIAAEGFNPSTLQLIDAYVNDIENGTTDFPRFNQQEHAGLCKAGPALIGASIVAGYAARSFAASGNAASSQGQCKSSAEVSSLNLCRDAACARSIEQGGPANWQIDQLQEQLIEQWAKAARLWVESSDSVLREGFGPMIAQGAEAKVYYRDGSPAVLKERASIYSTTQKAIDAIALHNALFPETAMHVIGFTRDSDDLFRIILIQPYVRCLRLATKAEIDALVGAMGFKDNGDGNGVNYISDRLALEDMHPANVFVDEVSERPICIDCIVKFTNNK